MKEGFWINAKTGAFHRVDEHRYWILREDNAALLGLGKEGLQEIKSVRGRQTAEGRRAILLRVMAEGMVRARGHGDHLTLEFTLPVETALQGCRSFLESVAGDSLNLEIHDLANGRFLSRGCRELLGELQAGDPQS